MESAPFFEEGEFYVPLRFAAETLGWHYAEDGDTITLSATKTWEWGVDFAPDGGYSLRPSDPVTQELELTVGERAFTLNGEAVESCSAGVPVRRDSVIYLPLDFLTFSDGDGQQSVPWLFGGSTYDMSLIEIVWGGGALVGGAIMGARVYRVNRIVLINLMNFIVGVSFTLSGMLSPGAFALFAVLSCIEGIAGGIFNASFVAVVQTRIDAGVLGRVMSLYYSFGLLPSAIGLLGTGFLAEQVGLTTTFVIAGTVIVLVGMTGFFIPSVMRLDRKA